MRALNSLFKQTEYIYIWTTEVGAVVCVRERKYKRYS